MKKIIHSLWKSFAAFVFGGIIITAYAFVTAIFCRLIYVAWHTGLRLFAVLFLLSALTISALQATSVFFSLSQITGYGRWDKFQIVPDPATNPNTDGTNIFGGPPILGTCVNGTNTLPLAPGGYTLVVPGWARSLHFNVHPTNVPVNVVNLITNGLATYVWGALASGFSGTVTNLIQIGAPITNLAITIAGASFVSVNETYYGLPTDAYDDGVYTATNGDYITVSGTGHSASLQTANGQFPYTGPGPFPYAGPPWDWQQADGSGSPNTPATTSSGWVIVGTNWVNHFNLTTFNGGLCVTNIFQ